VGGSVASPIPTRPRHTTMLAKPTLCREDRRRAPRCETRSDHSRSGLSVGHPPQQEGSEGEDDDEDRPYQETDIGPREAQVGHEHRAKGRHELPVNVTENVEGGEEPARALSDTRRSIL
jgi:hypothetical protein